MAIENINDYAGMWANGVNIGQLWDKIKEKFVSGAHVQSDATTYPASWKQQARANIGLTIGANKMWYGSAANTIGEVTTTPFGRGLLNTSSGSEVTGLFAETAEKDKNGIEISENYAHSLAITDGYLRLKNNRYVSGAASAQDLSALQLNVKLGLLQLDNTGSAGKIPLVHIPDSIMGQLTYGGTITAYTQSTDSLTVSITTGAKAILEQKTGRTIGNKTVKLVATASDPSDTSSIAYFNYTDCTGIYFIWTADALETHTGEPDYRVWPSGGPRYQAGDWLISNDTKWDKVDNTDAVTGVKGSNESAFRLGNVSIDALDVRALATYLTNTTQNVEDKVQFKKDIWSLGGVAAYGISDLSAGGGGGGGLSGTIIRNWSNYQGAETEVLGANLGMRGFRMSGYSFQVNKPAVNTDNWQTEFTLGTENIPDLPLTQITGTTELRKIETLSATGTPSGFLKRASNGDWSFDTNSYALASALNNYLPLTGGTLYKDNNDVLLTFKTSSSFNTAWIGFNPANSGLRYLGVDSDNNLKYQYNSQSYKIWHAGNDGLGSGLDADKLDGYEASGLFESLTNDSDQLKIQIGNTSKSLTLDYAKKTSRMRTEIKADQEFVYRQSPQTIDADSLVINKFKGRTLVWNQLCPKSTKASFTSSNVTFTNNNDGTWTLNGTSNALSTPGLGSLNVYFIATHKYLLRGSCGNGIELYLESSTIWGSTKYDIGSGVIATCVSSGSNSPWLLIQNGHTYNNAVVAPQITDLTLMFGAGNEPSTVAEFEALYPESYYPYNAGELRNNDAKAIKTSNNLWDGGVTETNAYIQEDGTIQTGENHYISSYVRVVAGKTYRLCNNGTILGNLASLAWYNSSKTLISAVKYGGVASFTATAPTNATYCRFAICPPPLEYDKFLFKIDDGVATCNIIENEVPINLDSIQVKSHNIWDEEWESGYYGSDGSKGDSTYIIRSVNYTKVLPNQTYYLKIPNTTIYICEYGADKNFISRSLTLTGSGTITVGANTAYIRFCIGTAGSPVTTYNNDVCINESSSFNGQYEPHGILTINGLKQAGSVYDEIVGKKFIQRVGSVDLGTLDWTLAETVFQSGLADKKIISGGWRVGGVCARYLISPSRNSRETPDKCFSYGWESTLLFVNDTSYSTVEAFKTAMNGVYLNYELATPIEYELASPIPDTMPAGTTERIISDRLPVTPFACDMTYGANPKDILASAVPFSRLQGVRLERGAFTMSTQNDSNWYLVTLGDKKLYLRFTVNTGAFKLEMASDDTENPEYSKSFEFATLSTSEIDAICV